MTLRCAPGRGSVVGLRFTVKQAKDATTSARQDPEANTTRALRLALSMLD